MDHPIQIVKYNKTIGKFDLDVQALDTILKNEHLRDVNIGVVSIAGVFRKGKSFLLGFFLRYLTEFFENGNVNWMGDENTELTGFSWRGGFRRHTTGIWVWSKVFTKTLPSGEKIGVMLMDTQGTFDSNSTVNDNVTIFSLSIMLSSIQVYNISQNIQENDLQHLKLFTDYGKLTMDHTNHKPFQKLLFLIRDWTFPYEATYGFGGGNQILENTLKIHNDSDEELKNIRTDLKLSFEEIACFLMPYPGHVVTSSQNFQGKLKDIDPEFKDMLMELIPGILSPEKFVVKKINGQKVLAQNLSNYLRQYWEVFNSPDLPTAKSILDATITAELETSYNQAKSYYTNLMDNLVSSNQPVIEFNQVVDNHNSNLQAAINQFSIKSILSQSERKAIYQMRLSENLQSKLLLYAAVNESKRTQSLEQALNNINDQINHMKNATQTQIALIESLRGQMSTYQTWSASEQQNLRTQMKFAIRRRLKFVNNHAS